MQRVISAFLLSGLALGCTAAPATGEGSSPPSEANGGVPGESAVATVLGRPILRAELSADAWALYQVILAELLEQFRHDRAITATEPEIARFVARIHDEQREAEGRAVGLDDAAMREIAREVARDFVVQWKTSKALHEQYGGVVVWEQTNPLDPVGAFNALLREQHERGAYVIHDPEAASEFWGLVERVPESFVVAPERVDFSRPWWD